MYLLRSLKGSSPHVHPVYSVHKTRSHIRTSSNFQQASAGLMVNYGKLAGELKIKLPNLLLRFGSVDSVKKMEVGSTKRPPGVGFLISFFLFSFFKIPQEKKV